jgi:hypothetical protein
VDVDHRYGLAWDEAWTLAAWRAMVARRNAPGERARAETLQRTSAALWERLGAGAETAPARTALP